MNVKFTETKIDGKVVQVSKVQECTPLEFIQKQKEAGKNLDVLVKWLLVKIENLEAKVRELSGED